MGDWRVFPDQGLLEGVDGQVHLEPKVMEVLVCLARHQDKVVKRDELIDEVWGGIPVTDEVLSRAISVLRTRLGDNRMTPSFIQTLPKVGYRLLMPVTPLAETELVVIPAKKIIGKWPVMLAAVLTMAAVIFYWIQPVVEVDPGSPAAFAHISDWFDFLAEEKAGTVAATSIAVLPFENLTDNSDSDSFSDGLTDELTVSLSKVKGLKVVARRSSYSFKNRTDDVPTIGRLLNVDAVFEGTIRRTGEKLRLNALLSSVSDGYLIWSDSFECEATEVFSMQESMATAVAEALRGHFTGGSLQIPLLEQAPPNIEAYQLYLINGNFLWKLRGEQPLRRSIKLYRQALAIDPNFSRAYIGLANSLVLLPFYSSEPMEKIFAEVEEILESHVFKDNRELGEVEAIHAFMAWHRWQWIEAEERFRKALALAPDSPNIYQWYSGLLSSVGRRHDSLEAAKRARELDEISPVINDRLGVAYLWENDNVRAAEHFAIGAQLGFRNAINPAYMILLLRLERYDEFKAVMAAFHRGLPASPDWLIENADTLFLKENREWAQDLAVQAMEEGRFGMPRLEFGLWLMIGANDQAYESFAEIQSTARQYLQLEAVFIEEARDFREDSRFEQLSRGIGWQEYWQKYDWPDED
ncbi:MAG: winged helix-turn-helix domain-containing protein [Xanthomonadales bacterium]|nr:winged helix-turn-helix domain-containing protein [Xanthomonadales bacterium]